MRGTVVVSVKLRGEDITRDAVLVPACKGGPEHKPSSEVVTKAGARCKPISLQNARQRLLSADEVGTDVKAIILPPLARAWSGEEKAGRGEAHLRVLPRIQTRVSGSCTPIPRGLKQKATPPKLNWGWLKGARRSQSQKYLGKGTASEGLIIQHEASDHRWKTDSMRLPDRCKCEAAHNEGWDPTPHPSIPGMMRQVSCSKSQDTW